MVLKKGSNSPLNRVKHSETSKIQAFHDCLISISIELKRYIVLKKDRAIDLKFAKEQNFNYLSLIIKQNNLFMYKSSLHRIDLRKD
jgi:hypothetical protein